MPKQHISATVMQNAFGKYMAQVIRTSKPVYIDKHGKPVAVLLDTQGWEVTSEREIPKKLTWSQRCLDLALKINKNPRNNQTPNLTSIELLRQLREETA